MSITILKNAMLAAKWRTAAELANLSDSDCRNIVIIDLNKNSADTIPVLQTKNDEYLAWHVFMYLWLKEAAIRTQQELEQLTLNQQKDITIIETNKHLGIPIPELQGMETSGLLRLAFRWWLERRLRPFTNRLNNVAIASNRKFDIKDNLTKQMDTLKVMVDGTNLLGIYHAYNGSTFDLFVAETNSADITNWTQIANLGTRGHQGDIKKMGTGYIVVNERDVPGQGNHIRVRYYNSLNDLKTNNAAKDIDLARSFSQSAEGTPNIISVRGTTPNDSDIFIGFHYYKNCQVDRQAYGVLKNFDASNWTSWENAEVNENLEAMGFYGNFGGRYNFDWDGLELTIFEANLVTGDDDIKWQSWRILVGCLGFFIPLELITPNNSFSFANPCVAKLSTQTYVACTFIPGEGAGSGEARELIYEF